MLCTQGFHLANGLVIDVTEHIVLHCGKSTTHSYHLCKGMNSCHEHRDPLDRWPGHRHHCAAVPGLSYSPKATHAIYTRGSIHATYTGSLPCT